MAKAAHDFGLGNLDARVQVDPKSSDEMQDLALAFNNMASSLQQSEYQRQEFVANVSHELKTPMTTISGFVDGMLDGTIPPQRHKQYMQMVSDETKRLSRLVRSMLDISRLQDQDIPDEKKSRFELQELAGQVLITFEQKIDAKHLNVDVDFPGHPTYTRAGPDYITQVIYNLLDNAVKFCPQGGQLGVRLKEGDRKILKLLRLISGLSLGLTLLALVGNILSVLGPTLLGDILNIVLLVVSVPMLCGKYWFLSLFLWAVILFASFSKIWKK